MPDQSALSSTVPEIPGYGELVEIGSGGFSRVYKARQFEFERPVAIKVLDNPLKDDESVRAFERECRTMGALWDHPNIVPVFASAFTSDGRACIVMKLFHEGSYFQVLRRTGPVPVEELLLVGVKISGALATAHDAGVVHGDVKPHNIFKSRFGEPALGDFGIATFVGQHSTDAPRGLSVHYAAPDLVEGEPGPKADQYSMAATIFTLSVGKRPFELSDDSGRDSNTQVLLRVLAATTPWLPETFPQHFRSVIRRAMDRDPDLRYDNLSDFGAALSEVEHSLKLSSTSLPSRSLPVEEPSVDIPRDDGPARTDKSEALSTPEDDSTTATQSDRKSISSTGRARRRLRWRASAKQPEGRRTSAEKPPDEDGAEAADETTSGTPERPVKSLPKGTVYRGVSPAGRTVEARVCGACEHAHPPTAAECTSCGMVLDERTSQSRTLPQPQLGAVRLPGDRVEALDANLVIGRHPATEPLEPHQRSVMIGEGDRSVSRRHIELRLDGWDLKAHVLGRNVQLKHQEDTSEVGSGAVVNLVLGDTLFFGTDSWLRYASSNAPKDQKNPTSGRKRQLARSQKQLVGLPEKTQPDSPGGNRESDSDNPVALSQSFIGTIELSDGSKEALNANLIIGRNPRQEPLEPHQRAVTHGGDDRTVSRRHLELTRTGHHPTAICLGNMIELERDRSLRELSKGAVVQLKPGDILHFGSSSWLRYHHTLPE